MKILSNQNKTLNHRILNSEKKNFEYFRVINYLMLILIIYEKKYIYFKYKALNKE